MSGIYSALEEAFEFCWSSFADEHNTLPKSTRRNVKSNKFAFWTPWLQDLLRKHWFTSSVCRAWNNGWSMDNVYTDRGVDQLVYASFSLPKWQAVKMTFFVPWIYKRQFWFMGPSWALALSYLSYKFDQPETTRDRAKVYLAIHHVHRLLQKLFWALSV